MSSRKSVLAKQAAWANKVGLTLDVNGYLPTWQANLHRPLSGQALSSFRSGSGNELRDSDGRPAKMRAAHSSSALVVNVFDYWSETPDRVLAALGLAPGAHSIVFEAQFATGLDGNPPNLDMCVRRIDGALLGVESKFTEWLAPKSASKEYFKPKYFPEERKLWSSLGLPGAQRLAEGIHARVEGYRYLDAPQLLKHALGLATSGQSFELYYLYYEVDGPEAAVHRTEIQEFQTAVERDFPFHAGTYQELYSRIRQQGGDGERDEAYLAYLGGRYFD
jgi:hypothetical protein